MNIIHSVDYTILIILIYILKIIFFYNFFKNLTLFNNNNKPTKFNVYKIFWIQFIVYYYNITYSISPNIIYY